MEYVADHNHYFVDEAGDAILFDRRGRVRIGEEGCSRYFILGVLWVSHPQQLTNELDDLRAALVVDPYFARVPSMQVSARRTARLFHATDDVPEVRREVMALLRRHPLRYFAAVKRKTEVLAYLRSREKRDPRYHYHPNELYDLLVRRVFRVVLTQDRNCLIHIAKRGKSDRTKALQQAVNIAHSRSLQARHLSASNAAVVRCVDPADCVCVQAADYLLWALQRYYELHEARYLEYLWPAFRVVIDIDDTTAKPYGRYYNSRHPMDYSRQKEKPGI